MICEVCFHPVSDTPVLDFGNQPLLNDLLPIGSTTAIHKYPVEILYCDNCCTAHQKYVVPKRAMYTQYYGYRSREVGAAARDGMQELVYNCKHHIGSLKGKNVLDVGCNDGTLLDYFKEAGAVTFGIEPTDAAHEAAKSHRVVHDFLTPETALAFLKEHSWQMGYMDIIVFTNVFAHIEHLPKLLKAIDILAKPGTLLVIENHYLGSIVASHQIDTFYHEHIRTYSYKSFEFISRSLNMVIVGVEFPRRYGGNIRVFMRSGIDGYTVLAEPSGHLGEQHFRSELVRMQHDIEKWKVRKQRQIHGLVSKYGSISAVALPARATIPVNLLKLDYPDIRQVYQIEGSPKIGYYIPGTRIPVVSDRKLARTDNVEDPPLLNLAWHIHADVERRVRELGYQGELIDVISQDDFS